MTINTLYVPDSYAGNGVLVTFPITFPFLDNASFIEVTLLNTATNALTTLHNPADYSVSGSNVVCVVAPATGYNLNITLVPDFLQESSYIENSPFPAATLEADLDKLTLEVQANSSLIGRGLSVDSIHFLAGIDTTITTSYTAGYLLRLNAAANGFELVDATTAGLGSALSPTTNGFIVGNGTVFTVQTGATARASLGVTIGTQVQAWDADLDALAGLATAADTIPYFTGSHTAALNNFTSVARTFVAQTSTANMVTQLGLTIGTNTQAWDADLDALAALSTTGIVARTASNTYVPRTITGTANKVTVSNGSGVAGNPTLTLPDALNLTAGASGATLQDPGDATKQVQFALSGITTGNTRTLTIPDSSGTLVYASGAVTSLAGTANQITASGSTGAVTLSLPSDIIVPSRVRMVKGADIASTGSMTWGTDGNFFHITGTTTITSFNSLAAGAIFYCEFTGILTLTHNASSLILPNAGNSITTAVGDCATFVSEGSGNWRCLCYSLASGGSLNTSGVSSVAGTANQIAVSGSTGAVTWSLPSDILLPGRIRFVQGVDIASTGSMTWGTDGNYFHITGTTTITAFNTLAKGALFWAEFTGILTLTYNAVSLILPTAASITTAAGDIACFVSEGSGNWRCLSYDRASGKPLVDNQVGTVTSVATAGLATGGAITSSGTVTVTAAVKSDQTTATSTTVAVVPNVQQNHPSAAKAWLKFAHISGTPTTTVSYNVSSLTDTAVGRVGVNLTVAMTTADYVFNVTGPYNIGTEQVIGFADATSVSTTSIARINFGTTSVGATDVSQGHMTLFGTQ